MNTNGIKKAETIRFLFMVIVIQLCSWSCNTRIEGCLDVQADNFDFDAELACSGCCTYPTIGLALSQKWQDRNFTNTDTLYDQFDQPYKIQDLKYFLTSWTWKDADGVVYTVDSAKADCGDEVLVYAPDNIIIDTRQFSYTMGNIRNSPEMTNLNFIAGITQDFNCLDPEDPAVPDNITKDSPLWNPETSSLSAIRMVLQLQIDTTLYDTVFVDLQQPFYIPYNESFIRGTDTQIKLTVDYNLWFSEVNVNDLSSFGQSVEQHLPGSIFPTP
jgi:hypothetical protein